MIDAAVRKILLTNAGVSALVGTRIYNGRAPQGTLFPCITISRISTVGRDLHHAGPAKISQPRFQISCWGGNTTEVRTLAVAVRKAVHGFKGNVTLTSSTEKIFWSRVVNEVDLYESDLGYQVAIDLILTHEET